jgi:DNA-binding NarL/FixJ family response regulator
MQDESGWDFWIISSNLPTTSFDLSHTIMSKPRVLLISSQNLFGEGIETILRAKNEVEVIGPWNLNDQNIYQRLHETQPSVIVIADDDLQSRAAAELTKIFIEQYPELFVIRTGLSENIFRVVSTHTRPARGDNLLEMIRDCSSQAGAPSLPGNTRITSKSGV